MDVVYRHPKRVLGGALAVAAGAVILIAAHVGYSEVADRFQAMEPAWLGLALGGQVAAFVGYALAYGRIVTALGGPKVDTGLLVRLVATGFGAFALGGGFALDYRALRSLEGDERAATVEPGARGARVRGPGTGCLRGCGGDADRGRRRARKRVWPWVVAVPVGFALGFWLGVRHSGLQREGRESSGACSPIRSPAST